MLNGVFGQKLLVENRKNEKRHGILGILISLGTNFQLKETISNFWTKFAGFRLKAEKVNLTIELCRF